MVNAARQSSTRGVLVDVGFSGGFIDDDDRHVPRALTVGALTAKLRRIELAMEREMERGLVAFNPSVVGSFQMASVKRKRKKAMNKHKHRKRRRRDRHKA
jgi:hypothetical protein